MIALESELKPIMANNKKKILLSTFSERHNNYEYIDEIDGGFGVVDVMFYKPHSKFLKKRKIEPIVSEEMINTLLFLKGKDIFSVTYLINNLRYSEEKIAQILSKQEKLGFIKKIDNEHYKKIFEYEIGIEKSVAIELKLKDWKKGLYQAYRYKWFSEASYLALYSKYATQAKKNINSFKEYNVGLIEVFDNGKIDIIYTPEINKPLSINSRAIASENLFKKLFFNTPVLVVCT